jgi:SAM-dependent methyltransferase
VDETARDQLKASFGDAAEQYRRGRPTYPPEAVRWLLTGTDTDPPPDLDVLDVGAGTGALTCQLGALVRTPIALEPSRQMLLAASPSGPRVQGVAEQLPFRPLTFDVATVAQAFHWLDHRRAHPELARVLRADGVLAVVYNTRDESRPWAKQFGELLLSAQSEKLQGNWGSRSVTSLGAPGANRLFPEVMHHQVSHEQLVSRADLVALAASRSYVIRLAEPDRSRLLTAVGELFDATLASDGPEVADPFHLRLDYVTDCWRARVVRGW